MADKFPQKSRHTQMAPEGEKPGYHKSSQSVGHGHMDSMNRMPHPQHEAPPEDESGEGQGD